MRKVFLIVALFFLASSLMAINVMIEESLTANNNIFADYTKKEDFINRLSSTIADKSVRENYVFWWQVYSSAESYFSNGSESNYLFSGFLKQRWKFNSSVLDLSGRFFYDWYPSFTTGVDVDNIAYTHFVGMGNVQYRYDFATSSVYLGYTFSGSYFPDYNLDAVTHRADSRYSFDLSLFTSVDLKISYAHIMYSERYVLLGGGSASSDEFYDNLFACSFGIKHFFTPGFSFVVNVFYEYLNSNGNYYISSSASLIDDFYSYSSYGVRLRVEKRFRLFKLDLGLDYLRKDYRGRFAFAAADNYIAGHKENNTTITVLGMVKYYLSQSMLLYVKGSFSDTDSNSYRSDAALLTGSVGVQLWF